MKRWTLWLCLCLLGGFALGCGGGGGGAGGGVTVTVTPRAVLVILSGTQQFLASVTGGSVQVATIVSGNGAVRAGNVVTITTTSAHGLSPGQSVTIAGVSDTSFNGTFTITTVPSTTTFTYAQTGADATSGGGTVSASTVKWSVNGVDGGNATFGTISTTGFYSAPASLPPATTATIASNGAVRSNNVVTITTTAAHNFVVGQVVTISGVTDTSFNGTFAIATAPSSTTFTYSQTASNATSGGGTVSSTAVQVKATSVADTTKSDTATVSLESGISINVSPKTATVGTGEMFQFFKTVTGSSNTNVTWAVTGGSTNGTISASGLYTAPAAVPSPPTVMITATAAVDPNKTATASVTVVTAADPTLTAINPTSAAQGSLFQDVYLTGTNFISTTAVLVNGTALPPSATTAASSTLLRARIPDCLLSAIPAGGTLAIAAQRFNGTTTPTQNLTVAAVRPALVGASPDSATQTPSGASVSFNVNGGYFGTIFGTFAPCTPPTSPAVTAEFNGSVRPAAVAARQLSVTIGGAAGSGDLSTPGLFSVAVRNTAAAQPVAVTNFAVQPSVANIPLTPLTTLDVGTQPGALAINTATGIAVVANRGSNSITLIDLTATPPKVIGAPIAVGTSPTGVAVDNVRNLALVANNGSKNVSVVNLGTAAVTATIDLTNASVTGTGPFSVGVNPLTGLGLVAYSPTDSSVHGTNNATLIDLTANPPAVIGTVTISTGQNPQVDVEPRLNWAVVTPGGGGSLSIVDLGRRTVSTIAAAPGGAVRSSNVVTITTTTDHRVIANEAVLITGVADPSFNGIFTVSAVPSSTTFTYVQTAANATSGGGSATYALPLATVTLGIGVRGIGINRETEKALLTDPTSTSLLFFSVLDQTVSTLPPPGPPLETGMVAAAVNPLTDIGVAINPGDGTGAGTASVIDPRTPARLATISVGTNPKAVAIDPGGNLAMVVNEGSNNVSILSLGAVSGPGAIRPLQITQINPFLIFTSAAPVTVTLTGTGFTAGSTVRLDGDSSGVTTSFDSAKPRLLTATIAPSRLGGPRRYALDVVNAGGTNSNVTDFTVIQAVDLTGTGCANPQPRAVAIEPELNLAVVTNPNCNNITLVNLTTGTVKTTLAVGKNPQGVAVISRLGKAVVTNRGDNNASLVDLANQSVGATPVTVGTEPIGVAINQDTATAVVANSASNTVSTFSADTGGTPSSTAVDARPVAVAIDPGRNLAVVANATQNNLNLIDLSQATPSVTAHIAGVQLPTAVVFDPVTGFFLANSSLTNNFLILDPDSQQTALVRLGINPTWMAYNFQSSTLVTTNTASNTVSVMDFLDRRVRAILGSGVAPHCQNPILVGSGSQQVQQEPPCGVDIHPRTNLGVFVDGDNNRLLLIPLPR